jgi:serine/threonine protein kinase
MELVRGIKITDYCDQNSLSTNERLELCLQVCRAVEHAHQKGIIHRDIKPSNVLVTLVDGAPVPKVIDFGIAKATQGRLTDQTLFTAIEQFLGTPAYMSPEQVELSGLDIDTRSDIYSLACSSMNCSPARPHSNKKPCSEQVWRSCDVSCGSKSHPAPPPGCSRSPRMICPRLPNGAKSTLPS